MNKINDSTKSIKNGISKLADIKNLHSSSTDTSKIITNVTDSALNIETMDLTSIPNSASKQPSSMKGINIKPMSNPMPPLPNFGKALDEKFDPSIIKPVSNPSPLDKKFNPKDLKPVTNPTPGIKISIDNEQLNEFYKETGATIVVGATSIASGIGKIVENIEDAGLWIEDKAIKGISYVSAQAAGLYSDDLKNDILDKREQTSINIRKEIARDKIGEINDNFYQNTEIGRKINEASMLKYDSETAKKIQNATTIVGKFVISTGATIVTGGAAAPFAFGFLNELGGKAEKTYQENINTSLKDEFGILLTGVGGGLNSIATGKMGANVVNLAKTIGENGIRQTAAAVGHNAKSFLTTIKNKGVSKTALDYVKSLNFGKTIVNSIKDTDNLLDSAGIIADNVTDWVTGEEEFNIESVKKAGGELAKAWVLNTFTDSLTDYFGGESFKRQAFFESNPKYAEISDLSNEYKEIYENLPLMEQIKHDDSKLNELRNKVFDISKNLSDDELKALINQNKTIADLFVPTTDEKLKLSPAELAKRYNIAFLGNLEMNTASVNEYIRVIEKNPELISKESQDAMINTVLNATKNVNDFDYLTLLSDRITNENKAKVINKVFDEIITKKDNLQSLQRIEEIANYIKRNNIDERQFGETARNIFRTGNWTPEMKKRMIDFSGGRISEDKIMACTDKVRFGIDEKMIENNWGGYNNADGSVIGLTGMDLIDVLTHESMHEISRTAGTSGINHISMGLNESLTDYFTELITGKKGNSGYSDAVEQLRVLVDNDVFTLDELKDAYFGNHAFPIDNKLISIVSGINKPQTNLEFIDDFYKAFDKSIKYGAERKEGLRELSSIVNKLVLQTKLGG